MWTWYTGRVVRRFLLVFGGLMWFGLAQAAPDVFVAYPDPNARVAFERVILEGSVTPGASLSIDGRSVPVGPDGMFMEWWPLKAGVNDLRFVARQGSQVGTATLRVTRVVPRVFPATPTVIDPSSVFPRDDLEFWDAAVDSDTERRVTISFQGSPGGKATFSVVGGSVQPLLEVQPGNYRATYVMPNHARFAAASVTVHLTGKDGRTVTAVASGRLTSTQGGPRLGIQKEGSVQGQGLNEATVVITNLQGEPLLYPRNGMQFTLVGRQGEDVRARLAPGISALISAKQLNITPGLMARAAGGVIRLEGAERPVAELQPASPPESSAPPAIPAVPVTSTEIQPVTSFAAASQAAGSGGGSDLGLRIPLGGVKLPFTIRQEDGGQRITVTLYGSWAAPLQGLVGGDPLVQDVQVRQVALAVTSVTWRLTTPQAWGFTASYDGTDLLVRVRRPPVLNALQPLLGRRITIDAGHGGTQKGGAGSLRIPEKNLVLPIALRVAQLLQQQGASVTLTREADVTLGLYERGLTAEQSGADLLVSLHANALPDGRDPRGIRGPEVYYTHPQAQAVAAAILAELRARLPELGPGSGLQPDAFLALTRPSTQISLLVELAYLTDAGNLRLLHDPSGQERLAQAVAAGIRAFYAAQVK